MQIIAPDFYAPFGSSSSANAGERPDDGLFDALLREEDARYNPAPRPERDYPEAIRPPHEDRRREEDLRSDRSELPGDARDPHQVAETPGEDHGPDPLEEEHSAVPHDDRGMTDEVKASDAQDTAETPAAEGPSEQVADVTAAAPAIALPGIADAVTPIALQNGKASMAETAIPATTGSAHGPTAGQTTPTGTAAPAASPVAAAVANAGLKAEETASQPKPGVATAERPADNSAPAAAVAKGVNQAPATERQAAAPLPFVAVDRPSRPAGRSTGASRSGDEGPTGLSSRPAAALGGGAATAALSQANQPAADTKPGATPKPIAGEAAATDQGQQAAGKQTAPQAAIAGKPPEAAFAAGSDKLAQASQATVASGGVETTAGSSSQLATNAPIGGTASAAGSQINSSSFAETLNNARHGAPADPAEQIALQVRHAQVAGKDKISIKLHPAELGRIEVKLESGTDGTLRAVISAERADTLDLLQRDARGLERALQDAGVKTDSGSLNFNLRGQGQGSERQADGGNTRGRGRDGDSLANNTGETAIAAQQQAASSHNGALDIRV